MESWSSRCSTSMLLKLNTSFRPSWRKLARAGIQDFRNCLDARFRGHDDKGALNC